MGLMQIWHQETHSSMAASVCSHTCNVQFFAVISFRAASCRPAALFCRPVQSISGSNAPRTAPITLFTILRQRSGLVDNGRTCSHKRGVCGKLHCCYKQAMRGD